MITVPLRFHLTVTTTADDADLSEHVGCVMAELLKLVDCDEKLMDPSVALDLSSGHVEVELLVVAETVGMAADHGDTAIHTAIHAAGGFTPGWNGAAAGAGNIEYDIDNIELQPA